MAKKDYVLESALKGDMDALENVLGGLLSPLFDLAFHFYDDVTRANACVADVLKKTANKIVENDLDGMKPILVAAKFQCSDLAQEAMSRGSWHEFLSGLSADSFLAFLTHLSLDLHDDELDRVLGLDHELGNSMNRDCLDESKIPLEEWRDIFDSHALQANLPVGLVDSIVTEIEDKES
ncbi:MAG: hypothetical protein ACI97A_000678 [Planctomycetota bacterium]|jgi:hypothetical protein